jgi:predicted nucleotidyltransferase
MLAESLKNEIIENLRTIDPFKVILFGSYAYGIPNEDSDIDLYIVTKENYVPVSFEENLRIKMEVYRALANFRKKYASDIMVHTLPVHQRFIELGSSFSREIMQRGINLI